MTSSCEATGSNSRGSPPAQDAGQAQSPNKPYGAGQSQRVTTPHDDDWDGDRDEIGYVVSGRIQRGTDGDDTLTGAMTALSDIALGGKKFVNILLGGAGEDTLTGGGGDDTFVFTNDSSSIGDKDTISNFPASPAWTTSAISRAGSPRDSAAT